MMAYGKAMGRLPRGHDPAIPHMSALSPSRRKFLAPIPPKLNYLDRTTNLGMMKNDSLGCCTAAGAFHSRQIWTAVAHDNQQNASDAEVVQFYSECTGYTPGKPETDAGAIEQEVLKRWLQVGLPVGQSRRHLLAFIELDPRNWNDIRRAIWECGVVYIGFNVPAWLEQASPLSTVWSRHPSLQAETIVGGHCVVLGGYDADTVHTVSWGEKYQIDRGFFTEFVDEAYALVSEDWVMTTGKTPLGMAAQELTDLMRNVATDGV